MEQLEELRKGIDQVDCHIVDLLNQRATISVKIGQTKRSSPLENGKEEVHVFFPGREKKVLEKLSSLNKGPLTDHSLKAIYREVISASISLQKPVSVGYLGPPGTFSHQACQLRFGDSVNHVDYPSVPAVFAAVEKGECTYGIVPFENSSHGSVITTLDRLIKTPLKARAELYLKVSHSLLSNVQMASIARIYSHEKALGSCLGWIKNNLPGVEMVEVSSTSVAAEMAASTPNSAAIASPVCARIYSLNILANNIQDQYDNTTRFLVLGSSFAETPTPTTKTNGEKPGVSPDKSMVVFTLNHKKPGSLSDVLSLFKHQSINITKIDTRPDTSKPAWHYHFLIEFEGHANNENVQQVLEAMHTLCPMVTVVGSYPNTIDSPLSYE